APRFARRPPQYQPLLKTQRFFLRSRGLADPEGNQGGKEPEQHQRQGGGQRGEVRGRDQGCRTQREYHGQPHGVDKVANAAAQALLGGGGRLPFQQVPAADEQAIEGDTDGVKEQPRLVGQKRDTERDLASRRG